MAKKNDSLGVMIESCREGLKTLIPDSLVALNNSGYDYQVNKKKTEIIVRSDNTDTIQTLIKEAVQIPNTVLKFVLTIKTSGGMTFIRQRVI